MAGVTAAKGPKTPGLYKALEAAGLRSRDVELLHRVLRSARIAQPRRPFREPGTSADELLFVRSGLLSRYVLDSVGRMQIVALYFPGDFIVPLSGLARSGIEGVVRSEVAVGSRADFDAALDSSIDLSGYFFRLAQRSEAISQEWLANRAKGDATARIAHLFCEFALRSGLPVDGAFASPFKQQQIADITCQTSVNVNRVLREMEQSGLLRRENGRLVRIDWPEMRRAANFRTEYLQM